MTCVLRIKVATTDLTEHSNQWQSTDKIRINKDDDFRPKECGGNWKLLSRLEGSATGSTSIQMRASACYFVLPFDEPTHASLFNVGEFDAKKKSSRESFSMCCKPFKSLSSKGATFFLLSSVWGFFSSNKKKAKNCPTDLYNLRILFVQYKCAIQS